MAFANSVQIGPEFFTKAKNDYSNWYWAIVREFMQNGIDCGSSRIDINLHEDGTNTSMIVRNNGASMSESELVNKLLALGASGKDFAGTVGGFGKAKELLYFCHLSYEIHSGSLRFVGRGAGYNIVDAPSFHGTESKILLNGVCTEQLSEQVRRFADECQWKGELYLNGKLLPTNLHKGRRRRDLGWSVVYTNKTFRHRMIIRIDGMPMFSRYVSLDRCVIVEINRSNGEALTSNRDCLTSDYRGKLDAFIDELTVDKSSALRNVPITTYHHFEGKRQEYGGANSDAVRELVTAAYATLPQLAAADSAEETATLTVDGRVDYNDADAEAVTHRLVRSTCSYEFIVKNNTGLRVPDYYMPHGFSAYSKKLVSVWVKCMLEMHRLFGHEDTFAVGFILDDERGAEHEKTDEYGRVYYINPAVVVEQLVSKSRSLKKRWKFNNAGKYAILAVVAHEFVHGLGFSPHDEGYAGKLTEVMGITMANKRCFHSCFR